MSNVIRLDFRAPRGDGVRLVFDILYEYGAAAGYRVLLIRDDTEPHGATYKVVVGDVRDVEVDVVAIEPYTVDGRFDANLIGAAIVRTLEVIGRRPAEPDAA
ncbi:hypothetical protein OPKNFCMD_2282 [Methylobacterium crusticola]|uniref:Uncharacterized protein n=1 Tax=Methylobacterium crusticola TaxID=1697972 RepID=A0ABQ4QY29_9HYPH|nr:hypothetical protein [Methylobacterium crusticola]GJD49551.1 hypothetical protein OPKNFCMD_2282 [Methylobacterium crusticola]